MEGESILPVALQREQGSLDSLLSSPQVAQVYSWVTSHLAPASALASYLGRPLPLTLGPIAGFVLQKRWYKAVIHPFHPESPLGFSQRAV